MDNALLTPSIWIDPDTLDELEDVIAAHPDFCNIHEALLDVARESDVARLNMIMGLVRQFEISLNYSIGPYRYVHMN